MPSRNLYRAIAAPAVLTLASVAPILGAFPAGTAGAQPAPCRRHVPTSSS